MSQAAEYEGCSLETVRRWIRTGDLSVRVQRNPATGRLQRYVRIDDVLQCARIMRNNQVATNTRNH